MAVFLWVVLGIASSAAAGVTFLRRRKLHGRRLYQESLERALADGILTAEEAQELASVRQQSDLTEAEVRMVALSLYRRALRDAVADSRITVQEDEQLQQLREQLGLSDRDLRDDVAQLRRVCVLSEVERGHLPNVDAPVQLATGEACHWAVQARLADRLAAPGRRSDLQAIRFEVSTYEHFSALGERTPLRNSEEMLPSDLGVLLVTSRRVVFRGAHRTVSVPHMKLAGVELFRDGLAVEESEPTHRSYFIVDDPELTAAVLLTAARLRRRELFGLTTRTA
jgi:hypothetical protein